MTALTPAPTATLETPYGPLTLRIVSDTWVHLTTHAERATRPVTGDSWHGEDEHLVINRVTYRFYADLHYIGDLDEYSGRKLPNGWSIKYQAYNLSRRSWSDGNATPSAMKAAVAVMTQAADFLGTAEGKALLAQGKVHDLARRINDKVLEVEKAEREANRLRGELRALQSEERQSKTAFLERRQAKAGFLNFLNDHVSVIAVSVPPPRG